MREIKFRAWDKRDCVMSAVWNISFKGWEDSQINYIELCGDGTYEIQEHEAVLMQYTGLKDKNDTEIYEGDIVLCSEEEYDREFKDTIIFKNATFAFSTYNSYSGGDFDWYTLEHVCEDELEILGNIYENPELLK